MTHQNKKLHRSREQDQTLDYGIATKTGLPITSIAASLCAGVCLICFTKTIIDDLKPRYAFDLLSAIASLPALILGAVAMKKSSGRIISILSFSTGIMVLLFWISLFSYGEYQNWYIDRYVDDHRLGTCSDTMAMVGGWATQYANNHAGKFPDKLEDALVPGTEDLATNFNCPISGRYLYFGAGLQIPLSPNVMILCDPLGDQHRGKVNALMGDGKVHVLSLKDAESLVQKAGNQAPPETTTQPTG